MVTAPCRKKQASKNEGWFFLSVGFFALGSTAVQKHQLIDACTVGLGGVAAGCFGCPMFNDPLKGSQNRQSSRPNNKRANSTIG